MDDWKGASLGVESALRSLEFSETTRQGSIWLRTWHARRPELPVHWQCSAHGLCPASCEGWVGCLETHLSLILQAASVAVLSSLVCRSRLRPVLDPVGASVAVFSPCVYLSFWPSLLEGFPAMIEAQIYCACVLQCAGRTRRQEQDLAIRLAVCVGEVRVVQWWPRGRFVGGKSTCALSEGKAAPLHFSRSDRTGRAEIYLCGKASSRVLFFFHCCASRARPSLHRPWLDALNHDSTSHFRHALLHYVPPQLRHDHRSVPYLAARHLESTCGSVIM
jgi:hypothetical protein